MKDIESMSLEEITAEISKRTEQNKKLIDQVLIDEYDRNDDQKDGRLFWFNYRTKQHAVILLKEIRRYQQYLESLLFED